MDTILYAGRFLNFVKRDTPKVWEFVARTNNVRAAFIAATTPAGELILVSEYRVPCLAYVVSLPAGLVADLDSNESLIQSANRELEEEAGYIASSVTFLTEGPSSAGLTSELISIVRADGLTPSGSGGGVEGEDITVYKVPLAQIDGFLTAKAAAGFLIEPKIYAALYFLGKKKVRPPWQPQNSRVTTGGS